MTRLIIKDFGAIKEADIEIKKYNIFIGHTSSGKSTVAKLIAIFNSSLFWTIKEGDFEMFHKLLEKYNIDFTIHSSTLIQYTNDKYSWEIGLNKFHSNYSDADLMVMANNIPESSYDFILKFIEKKEKDDSLKDLIGFLKKIIERNGTNISFLELIKPTLLDAISEKRTPVYIPAERLLISTFSNSIFSLLQAGASIPDCIKDFGSLYEKARVKYKNLDIDILNINVNFSNNGDTVYLKEDDKTLKISQASSGIQSVIPLWTVFNRYVESLEKQILVIEEPELNLFPTSQYLLVDWIIKKMSQSNGNIVITTHSPYVLSTIDNLILAQEILKKKNTPSITRKIKKLIPSMALIDFDDVSSYFFHSNGTVKDIRDRELKSLGAEYIDEASNDLGRIFNELCNLENEL